MKEKFDNDFENIGKELVSDFGKSIIGEGYEITQDLMEIGIDTFIDNEIVKQIPILKTISGFYKLSRAIRNKHLLKKTALFLQSFSSGEIDPKKLEKYRKKLNNKDKDLEEELERILLLLDTILDKKKAQILGRLYRNYINEKISFDEFYDLSEVTNRLFLTDIDVIETCSEKGGADSENFDEFKFDRLIALGILRNEKRINGGSGHFLVSPENGEILYDVVLTQLGEHYFEYGLKEYDN